MFRLPSLAPPDADRLKADGVRLRRAVFSAGAVVLFLWCIHAVLWLANANPGYWGVWPRVPSHAWGVLTAPLVHGSWGHLVANTAPLAFLWAAGLYAYPMAFRVALPFVWLGSGAMVWAAARSSAHIGASGVIYGLMAWVVAQAMWRRDRVSLALALGALFLYGGMVWGLLPLDASVSVEAHVAGVLAGVVAAWVGHDRDPPPALHQVDREEPPEGGDP